MTNEELRKLVDKGRQLKEQADTIELELKKVKTVIQKEAKTRKVGYFLGDNHFCRVSPQTFTDCDPEQFHETMMELDRLEEYYDCIKVKVTEARDALGVTVFDSISTTKSEPYKKVSFLLKAPKKYLE